MSKITFNFAFTQMSNDNLQQMFQIINNRRMSPLEYKPVAQRSEDYIPSAKHHIIPRSWYKHNGYDVDNSSYNVIRLSIIEHIKVHILLAKYYKDINDNTMYYAMLQSVQFIFNGTGLDPMSIELDDDILKILEFVYEDSCKIRSKMAKERWENLPEEVKLTHGKKISQALLNMDPIKKAAYSKLISIARKAYLTSLSEEEKLRQQNLRIESSRITVANWSDERRKEVNTRRGVSISKAWEELPLEKKLEHNEHLSKICKQTWENATEEERQQRIANSKAGQKEFWANASDEYKDEYSQIRKNLWLNMSDAEHQEHANKTSIGTKKAFANLPDDSRERIRANGRKRKGSIHIYNEELKIHKFLSHEKAQYFLENENYVLGNPERRWKKERLALLTINRE